MAAARVVDGDLREAEAHLVVDARERLERGAEHGLEVDERPAEDATDRHGRHGTVAAAMTGAFYVAAFAVATTLVLLLLAMLLRRRFAGTASLGSGNDAQRLEAVGEVIGVFVVAGATVRDGVLEEGVLHDVVACAVYGVVALVAAMIMGRIGVRLLLGDIKAELARDNEAAGIAAAGQIIASRSSRRAPSWGAICTASGSRSRSSSSGR